MKDVGCEITKFTKIGGPLTKRIFLSPEGALASDQSACKMWQGTAERVKIASVDELAELIHNLSSEQAIALGRLRAGLDDKVAITTDKRLLRLRKLNGGADRPDLASRTAINIVYHDNIPAYALFDFDNKGMPREVAARLSGGVWETLVSVLPAMLTVERVVRRSTSTGLYREDTREKFPGSSGQHIFIRINDGSDAPRFIRAMHDRCWLAGLGWMMLGKTGQVLERSAVDRIVGGSERLVFEGAPDLVPPLRQDRESRRPAVTKGTMLDTRADCPPLSAAEQARVEKLKEQDRARIAPESRKVQKAYTEKEVARLVTHKGKDEKTARKMVERWHEGVLYPDVELPFDDPELEGCTVADILSNPERFAGETLADPHEGIEYGRCKAMIMLRKSGEPWIHSFAHGRTVYELRHDFTALQAALAACAKDEVVRRLAELAALAEVDAIELAELRQQAKKLSGAGLREINAIVKLAQQKHAAQAAKQKQEWRDEQRQDPRPLIKAPFVEAPWLPQMAAINEVLGAVASDTPPSRDIEGAAVLVRKIPVLDVHVFTSANAEGDD